MKVSVVDLRKTGRKSPWMVIYYKDRSPVRAFFAAREQATLHAAELRGILRLSFSPEELAEVSRLVAGTNYALAALVKSGLDHIRASGATSVSPNTTFAAATEVVIQRAMEDKLRSATLRSYRDHYRTLNRTFGSRIVTTITEQDVRDYSARLKNRKGECGKATNHTKRDVIKYMKTALRAVGLSNPLPLLRMPRIGDQPVKFYTLDQVRQLFERTHEDDRGVLALALFAGLRPELLNQIEVGDVDTKNRRVYIRAEAAKDRKPHELEGHFFGHKRQMKPGLPDVLWDWLAKYPIKKSSWTSFQKRCKKALDGFWIADGLRHTAATYYAKRYGKEAARALLTHESPELAEKYYIGKTEIETAEAFFALGPNSIKTTLPIRLTTKPIPWPSNDVLAIMVQQKPTRQIAKDLGCSDVAIFKRCRKYGIPKPGVGEWARRQYQGWPVEVMHVRSEAGALPSN